MIIYKAKVCDRGYTLTKDGKHITPRVKASSTESFGMFTLNIPETTKILEELMDCEDKYLEYEIIRAVDRLGFMLDPFTDREMADVVKAKGKTIKVSLVEKEPYSMWVNIINEFRDMRLAFKQGDFTKVLDNRGWNTVSTKYRPAIYDSREGFVFEQYCNSLRDFLILCFLDSINVKQDYRECNVCRKKYKFNRSNSRFCSNACRAKYGRMTKISENYQLINNKLESVVKYGMIKEFSKYLRKEKDLIKRERGEAFIEAISSDDEKIKRRIVRWLDKYMKDADTIVEKASGIKVPVTQVSSSILDVALWDLLEDFKEGYFRI